MNSDDPGSNRRPLRPPSVKPSASTRRALEVVTFLAEHPSARFSTAALARRLGQNRTTCQSVLFALEEAGWVERTGEGYALGAVPITVGQAAKAALPVIEECEREMADLHAKVGIDASALIAQGEQMLVVASVGATRLFGSTSPASQSIPLRPPFGLVFVAWDETSLTAWLHRAPGLSDTDRERHLRAADLVRRLGYSVTWDTTTQRRLGAILKSGDADWAQRVEMVDAIAHDENYLMVDAQSAPGQAVTQIAAPVFFPDGTVAAAISALAFPHELSLEALPAVAQQIKASADAVSARLTSR